MQPWEDIRDQASQAFGETPGPNLEFRLIEAFETRPHHVISTIERITSRVTAGSPIKSPWAIVGHELDNAPKPLTKNPSDTKERDLRIRQSEAWIRNAGLYIDVERELVSELFDEGGQLHPWRSDQLEARMVVLWENERPRGEQAERDTVSRAEGRKAIRALQQEVQRSATSTHPAATATNATASTSDSETSASTGSSSTSGPATSAGSSTVPATESDNAAATLSATTASSQ
jgi:hypothetical protein